MPTKKKKSDKPTKPVYIRILSFTPAMPGWTACFRGDDPREPMFEQPVIGWAVVEDEDDHFRYQRVVPFVCQEDDGPQMVEVATAAHMSQYIGVRAPNESPNRVIARAAETLALYDDAGRPLNVPIEE